MSYYKVLVVQAMRVVKAQTKKDAIYLLVKAYADSSQCHLGLVLHRQGNRDVSLLRNVHEIT